MILMARAFIIAVVVCVSAAVAATSVAAASDNKVAKGMRSEGRNAHRVLLTGSPGPQDDENADDEENERSIGLRKPIITTPRRPRSQRAEKTRQKKNSGFDAVLDLFTGRRPQMLNPSMSPGQSVTEWSDERFLQAATSRSLQLAEALDARALKSDPAEFVGLLRKILQTAASTSPPVPPTLAPPAVAIPAQPAIQRPTAPVRRAPKEKGPALGRTLKFRALPAEPQQPKPAAAAVVQPSAKPVVPTLLTDRQLVELVVSQLRTTGTSDAWQVLADIVSASQQTPLKVREAATVVFQQVLGDAELELARGEDLAIAAVEGGSQAAPAREVFASLAGQAMRASLHLGSGTPENSAAEATPVPVAAPSAIKIRLGRRPGRDDDDGGQSASITPPQGARPAPPPVKLPAESISALIPLMRSDALAMAVGRRLAATPNLADGEEMLTLASMLPNIDLRHAMFTYLDENRTQGADALLSGTMYNSGARDPAHLLVLKSLPRQKKTRPGRTPAEPDASSVSWAKATWEVVQTLSQQLRQAAEDPELSWTGPLPLRLHRGAVPDVAIQLQIPDGFQGTEKTPAGTRVYYARCSVSPASANETKQLAEHYEERTNGIRRALKDHGVLWFDGLRKGDDGTRMTMDVIIRKAEAAAQPTFGAATAGAGQQFTIEAITVVAADPRDSPAVRNAPEVEISGAGQSGPE